MKTFRSTVAVILSVLMLLSVCTVASVSASAESTNSIYLVPSDDWKNDGARFAAYFYNASGDKTWASMNDDDTDGTYETAIPDGNWETVIFCRMNPANTENDWTNKWNQTSDLHLDSTNNCFTITPGSWDGEGTWSVFSTETQPTTKPTAPVEAGKVIVTTTSNGTDLSTAKCDTDNVKLITVTFKLQSEKMITNYQGTIHYDSDALELDSFVPFDTGAVYNTNLDSMIKFNGSVVQNLYDFTTAKNFCTITFKAKADCNTNVALDFEELNASTDPNTATVESTFPLISGSEVVGAFSLTSDVAIEKVKEDVVVVPDPPKPSVKLKASKINAGSRTRVTVSNAKGAKIKYSSSKKDVATIDSKGIITGLRKGTTKLTIKVGSTVVKKNLTVKNSPAVKNGKKTLKNKATITVKKGKTVKLTITGKASAIKNKVSVKSKKIAKITSKSTQTKVTFKAKKKGSTTLTVKINNVVTYKFKIKVK